MPNRILKESVCTSESIDKLSWFEEVMFYRLLVNCDDYGCFDARPAILRARLFPLKSVAEKQITDALKKLGSVGIIRVYLHEGKPYLQFISWAQHQQIRSRRRKYPEPDINCNQMISTDITCWPNPIQSNPIRIQSETESESKSESEIESESESESKICSELSGDISELEVAPIIELPLNDGSMFGVTREQVDKWTPLYPAVDVLAEIRKMVGWLDSHPNNKKTERGIRSFITGWLGRCQDSARTQRQYKDPKSKAGRWDDLNDITGFDTSVQHD
jgi:hypothetical protein